MKVINLWLLAIFIRPSIQADQCSKALIAQSCCQNNGKGPCRTCTGASICDGTYSQLDQSCDYNDASCGAEADCNTLTPTDLSSVDMTFTEDLGWQAYEYDYTQFFVQDNPNQCGVFNCKIRLNTAAANDCSTKGNIDNTYGVELVSQANSPPQKITIEIDSGASKWPNIYYFVLKCKGQIRIHDSGCFPITLNAADPTCWSTNTVTTGVAVPNIDYYFESGTSNEQSIVIYATDQYQLSDTNCAFQRCEVVKDVVSGSATQSQLVTLVQTQTNLHEFQLTIDTAVHLQESATLRCYENFVGSGYVKQADEDGSATCQGLVRFGHVATNMWSTDQTVTGTYTCSADYFGITDPAFGFIKECQCNTDITPYHDNGPFAVNINYCSTLFAISLTQYTYSYTLPPSGSGTSTEAIFASGDDFASTSDSASCPKVSYELVDTSDSSAFTHSAITFDRTTGQLDFTYDKGANYLIEDANFRIRVKASSAADDYITTSQIQIKTECHPDTTTFTEGSFPGGLSSTQEVQTGLNAYFTLPSYSVTPLHCDLQTTYQISDNSGTINAPVSGFLNDPIIVSAVYYHVVPQSTSLESAYTFYVWLTASGGKQQAFPYTLIVGCSTGVTCTDTWTGTPQNTYVAIGDTGVDVYTIIPPIISLSYCQISAYAVVGQTLLSAAASCSGTQPCTSLDLDMTTVNTLTDLTFSIQITIGSLRPRNSATETLKIYCSANHVTMSTTFDQQSLNLIKGDIQNNQISFNQPTCNYQVCCDGLSFTFTFVDSSETSLSTLNKNSILSTPQWDSAQSKYLSTVNVGTETDFSVKLIVETSQFTNKKGETVKYKQFSGDLSISIGTSCGKDIFEIKKSGDTYFTNALVPLAVINTTVGNFTNSLDLSTTFSNSESDSCPISKFKIWKTSPAMYQNDYFEISAAGVFSLKDKTKIIKECQVYLSAYNGKIWSDSQLKDYQILVNITQDTSAVPNFETIIEIEDVDNQETLTQGEQNGTSGDNQPQETEIVQDSIQEEINESKVSSEFLEKLFEHIYKKDKNETANKDDAYKIESSYEKESREPIELEIDSISQLGEVTIRFSERLKSISDINKDFDLQIISTPQVFDVEYGNKTAPNILEETPEAEIRSWIVQNFTQTRMILRLNFTNPIYVSTGEEKDTLTIGFNVPELFQSADGQVFLKKNYTITTVLPQQMTSEEEFEEKNDIATSAQNTFSAAILVPIGFQVLLKFAMDLVWPIVYNLQLITKQTYFEKILLPGPVVLLYNQIDKIANFQLTDLAVIKNSEFYQGSQRFGKNVLKIVGPIAVLAGGVTSFTLIAIALNKSIKFTTKHGLKRLQLVLEKIKMMLMWSMPLRALMLYYFIQTETLISKLFLSFTQVQGTAKKVDNNGQQRILQAVDTQDKARSMDMEIFVLAVIVLLAMSLPIVVLKCLQSNRPFLLKKDIMGSYDVVYKNQRVDSRFIYPLYATPIFLAKRFLIASSAALFQHLPLLQIATCLYTTLFTLSYNLNVKPMDSKPMNAIEIMNDSILMLTCYNLFIFTDFVPDVELRYSYSNSVFYMMNITLVSQVTLIIGKIIYDLMSLIRLRRQRADYRKQLKYRFQQLEIEMAENIVKDQQRQQIEKEELEANLSAVQNMLAREELEEQKITEQKIDEEKAHLEKELRTYRNILDYNSKRIYPDWRVNYLVNEKRKALVENEVLKERRVLESRSQYENNTQILSKSKPKPIQKFITSIEEPDVDQNQKNREFVHIEQHSYCSSMTYNKPEDDPCDNQIQVKHKQMKKSLYQRQIVQMLQN